MATKDNEVATTTDNAPAENKETKPAIDTKELSPLKNTAALVAKYAGRLTNDERAQQFYAQVMLMARQNPKIAVCTADSLMAAMMACVHLDLMPNTPEQLAFIIPYENRTTHIVEAQFQVGYKGMIALAYRSAGIASINAELVFAEDTFEVNLGMRTINHVPDLTIDRTDFDKIVNAYAVAFPVSGNRPIFEVLSNSEIEKIRKEVKAKASDTPWVKWPEVMTKKTAIKKLAKVLPQSSKDNRMQLAAAFDSWAEAGKLKVEVDNDTAQVVQGEPSQVTVDYDKINADVAAAKASINDTKATEGADPHREIAKDGDAAGGVQTFAPGTTELAGGTKVVVNESTIIEEAEIVEPTITIDLDYQNQLIERIDDLHLSGSGRVALVKAATGKLKPGLFTSDEQWQALDDYVTRVENDEQAVDIKWLAGMPTDNKGHNGKGVKD